MTYAFQIKKDGNEIAHGSRNSLDQAKHAAEQAYVDIGMGNAVVKINGPRTEYLLSPSQRGGSGIARMSWRVMGKRQ